MEPYSTHMPVNGRNAFVCSWFEQFAGDDLLDCQHDAIFTPDANRSPTVLYCLHCILDLEVPAIWREDRVRQIVARTYRRLAKWSAFEMPGLQRYHACIASGAYHGVFCAVRSSGDSRGGRGDEGWRCVEALGCWLYNLQASGNPKPRRNAGALYSCLRYQYMRHHVIHPERHAWRLQGTMISHAERFNSPALLPPRRQP